MFVGGENMKRFFYICLILLLGISLMVGCNKTDTETSDPEANGTSSKNSQENAKDKVSDQTIKDLIAKGERVKECTYDLVYSEGNVKVLTSKCYYRDMVLRSEPQGSPYVYIMDIDAVTEFSPTTKEGRVISFDQYTSKDIETPKSFLDLYLAYPDFSYESTETYDNVECYVITVNSPNGLFKAWLHSTIGLFIKVDGGDSAFEFKNLKTGTGLVSDSLMQVPPDVAVERGLDF
jgi:hypothetical protein